MLAIVMIVLLVVLTIGWVLLNVFGATSGGPWAGVYWALLSIGTTFIGVLLAGVILYLVLSIKAINLNRRQSNFIDSVTHELKSPIASMKLYLQTLDRHQVSQEEQADFYRFMLEDLERLDRLINQLLDAGRLESGRPTARWRTCRWRRCCSDCARTVCLRYRVPPETVQLRSAALHGRGRRVDLDIIFRNLIDNAVKYAGSRRRSRSRCGRRPTTGSSSGSPTTAAASRTSFRGRDLRPLRAAGTGTGTRQARHRPGAVHRPHAGAAAPRPHPRPRSRARRRNGVRGAVAGGE